MEVAIFNSLFISSLTLNPDSMAPFMEALWMDVCSPAKWNISSDLDKISRKSFWPTPATE